MLKGFQHRAARRITEMTAKHGAGREWEYPSVVAEMEDAGLHTIMDYIRRRQATTAERAACRPIYELCIKAEWMPGTSCRMRWWDQDVVNEPGE